MNLYRMTQLGFMAESENKLETDPFINSSIFHRGIPNRATFLCFNHDLHRTDFGEDAWIGQMSESGPIGGPRSWWFTSINVHMGQYGPWCSGRQLKPNTVDQE
jgi:hypothetical protein